MHQPHQDRHVPAETNGGWGFAGIIVGLALVCVAFATIVYQRTYKHPTDVTFQTPSAAAKSGSSGH